MEKCPHYHGVCGIDERIICYSMSDINCDIRKKYERETSITLNRPTKKRFIKYILKKGFKHE